MLADQLLEGEDAHAAVLAGFGGPADLSQGAGPGVDCTDDLFVADHRAMTHDHLTMVRLTSLTGDPILLGGTVLTFGLIRE